MRTMLIVAVMILAAVRSAQADWPLKGLPDEAQLAYQVLCRADVFAFGPIGVGAFTSEGDLSVRILMRYPNAVAIFQLVADQATPEGGLYALAVLRTLDRNGYKESLAQFKKSLSRAEHPRKKVALQAACMLHDEPVAKVLTTLDAGTYDSLIPKREK